MVAFSVETVSVTVGGAGSGMGTDGGATTAVGVEDVVTEGTGRSDVPVPCTTPGRCVESFDTVTTANTIAASRKTPSPPATTDMGDLWYQVRRAGALATGSVFSNRIAVWPMVLDGMRRP